MISALELGRASYAARSWSPAYDELTRADVDTPLCANDLLMLAHSSFMLGRMDDFLEVIERTHNAYADEGDLPAATRCAFYLGVNLSIRGELARASGWFGRGQRLLERHDAECAEHGYLQLPGAMRHLATGEPDIAERTAAAAVECGERFGDADLVALALHIQGQALIKQARVEEGLTRLDEAMLAVTADEVSPIISGVVYCGVIAGCEEAYDVRRAQEWTDALTQWWESQPDLVAFTGRCLTHRAGIMQLRGAWAEALEETRRARERCEQAMNDAAAGQALYQQGELHRLQGDFAAAEAEIALAVGDLDEARRAADELSAIAVDYDSIMLRAIAAQTQGMVAVVEADPRSALASLRAAQATWQELAAPYEAARTRVFVALACRSLGDEDTATLELEAATTAFERLGALPDLARLEALARPEPQETHGLTARELEVLRLVAAGKTNRDVARELVVSEHTVARHVQNIFMKLRVSSRTAATAFAFEHDLV